MFIAAVWRRVWRISGAVILTGHVVATVKAHDRDSDDNALIRYELDKSRHDSQPAARRLFHLDTHTGQLSLTETLDLSVDDVTVYRLYLTATDHGSPPRSSTASLKVIVGHGAALKVMTSRVGVSVYVTSAVCAGCFLLASFLLFVAVIRRRRRHGNQHRRHHQHERLTRSISEHASHETAHILPSCVVDKSRPLRDLEHSDVDDLTTRRLQVTTFLH